NLEQRSSIPTEEFRSRYVESKQSAPNIDESQTQNNSVNSELDNGDDKYQFTMPPLRIDMTNIVSGNEQKQSVNELPPIILPLSEEPETDIEESKNSQPDTPYRDD